jgi:hypothetical protein
MRLFVILGDPLNSFPVPPETIPCQNVETQSVFSARDASIYLLLSRCSKVGIVSCPPLSSVFLLIPLEKRLLNALNSLISLSSLNFLPCFNFSSVGLSFLWLYNIAPARDTPPLCVLSATPASFRKHQLHDDSDASCANLERSNRLGINDSIADNFIFTYSSWTCEGNWANVAPYPTIPCGVAPHGSRILTAKSLPHFPLSTHSLLRADFLPDNSMSLDEETAA